MKLERGLDLTSHLLERVRLYTKGLPRDAHGLALAAALEANPNDRAWKLVQLAAALRRDGDDESALVALDAAVALRPSADAERAAYTCAIAIHTERGDLELAHRIGREQLALGVSEKLLSALLKTYWESFAATGYEAFRQEWRRLSVELAGLRAGAA